MDRPYLGILLMLGFCILAPLGDSIAKVLGGTISLGVLLLTRFGLQALLLAPMVAVSRRSLRLSRRMLRLTFLRSVLHIIGVGLMFASLRYLPLADALAIAFVMPFIMLILGHYVLEEHVGPQRMIACGVGFIGTLLVIQPNFVEVGWPALLPLGVAVVFAFFILVTRQIAKDIDPITLQTISGVQASLILLPIVFLFPQGQDFSEPIGTSTIVLLIALGFLGTVAHLLMTWSLRFAPAATLAPMQYLEIPIGTIIGWMVFADLPNGLAAIGICITVGAGIYIILRERRLSQQEAPPAPASQ